MKVLGIELSEIEDPATQKAIKVLAEEMEKIKNLPPVTENPKQISAIVNRITGNL